MDAASLQLCGHVNLCFFFYISAFIVTPTSVSAPLGSIANFTCSASMGLVGWTVNGLHLRDLNQMDVTANTTGRLSTLYIRATEEYNNATVICTVVNPEGEFLDSDPAVLRVLGML